MGQRRERRLQRARHVRVGIAVGTGLAVLAGAATILGTTFDDGSAAAGSSAAAAPAAAAFVRPAQPETAAPQAAQQPAKQPAEQEARQPAKPETKAAAKPRAQQTSKRVGAKTRLLYHSEVKSVIMKRPPNPFPDPPANSGTGRRVVYCNSCQRVWLVEADGWVTHYYKVSGRRNYPRSGTYKVIRRINPGWSHTLRLPYFVGFTYGNTTDVGFHGIPKRPNGSQIQSDSELGLWRSHGCVRESQTDAKIMWDWASMGTTVVAIP